MPTSEIWLSVTGMFTMDGKAEEELRTATDEAFIDSEYETGLEGLELWIRQLRATGHNFADGHGILTGAVVRQSVR